jgi:sulfatase maturation enzyme AslB (radical SAM superfamily)
MVPWETVTRIVDECAELGVYSILFSWRGESTMYRSKHNGKTYRFADALKYARDKGILEVSSLTNGQLIDEEMARQIVDAEPNWINFSIDGMETAYNKIRTPRNKIGTDYNAFKVVTGNLKRLVDIRNACGKTRPQIRTNTVFPPISHDPDEYYNFMKGIGVDWVTVNEILDFRGSGIDGMELPEDAIKADWACQYPFQRLMISANGVMVPCTGAHNEEPSLNLGSYTGSLPKKTRQKDGSYKTADIKHVSLKEAWNSKKLNAIRKLHQTGKRTAIDGCRNCRHGAVKYGVEWVPEDWNMELMEWTGRKFRNG